MSLPTALVVGALLVSPGRALAASGQLLVLGSGECPSAELRTAARGLHEALGSPADAAEDTAGSLLQQLRPLPSQSLEDVQRQLESARTHFYDGKLGQAESQIAAALAALEQLPPGEERWALSVELRLLRYLTLHAQRSTEAAVAAFHEVLRLEPGHELDANYYSPGTRKAFERERKQLTRASRGKVTVTSSPSGAEVFLDGKRVGRTPLSMDVLPGSYQVQVEKEGTSSFSRFTQVQEGRGAAVSVDLGFEGSVIAGQPPCVQARADAADPLRGALKLGALLGVSDVVIVRVLRGGAGPATVSALLLNLESGQVVREGTVRLTPSGELGPGSADLATFIRTGKATRSIQVKQGSTVPTESVATAPPPAAPPPAAPAPALSAPLVPSPAPDAPVVATSALPPAAQSAGTGASGRSLLRVASYGVAGLGAAGLAGALVLWAGSQPEVKQFDGRLQEGALVEGDEEGRRLYLQLQERSRLMTGLVLGGGASLAAGAAMFLLSAPPAESALSLSLSPTPGGAAAHVKGRF